MNGEVKLLQQFGDELKPPGDQPPAELRRRVLTSALSDRGHRTVRARSRSLVRPQRLVLAAATVAVAVVGVVIAAGPRLSGSTPDHDPVASPGQLLDLAAQHAALAPHSAARPDQFRYAESLVLRTEVAEGGWTRRDSPVLLVRRWQSVDGTRDGLVQERPADAPDAAWHSDLIPGCRNQQPCGGRHEALPTDGDSMYQFLYRPPGAGATEWQLPGGSADDIALERVTRVLSSGQASPAVQHAVFAALRRIPGISVRPHAVDVAGRTGVGLVYTGLGGETELVFDANTYEYLGLNRPLGRRTQELRQDGHVVMREAILRVAVVDHVGDLA